MLWFILGLLIGTALGVGSMASLKESKVQTLLKKVMEERPFTPQMAQFIDPVSGKEKFSKAENVTDLTDE